MQLTKGSSTKKNSEINARYCSSQNIPITDINKISPTESTIKSQISKLVLNMHA